MGLLALALALGFGAGVLAGLFGVGGGILFVPTLTLVLGLTQLHATASSLLAILPAAAAGSWSQHRYGNVRLKSALLIALGSVVGVEGGVLTAEYLSETLLRRLFGAFMIFTALQIAWRFRHPPTYAADDVRG